MSSQNGVLQGAITAKIKGLNTAAGDRVFAVVPTSAQYPYVCVWAGYENPVDEECWDRTESTLQIDVWADTVSYFQTKLIAAAIRNALHEQPMTVSGLVVDRVRVETISYTDEPPRYRARISLSIETQPA